MKLISKAGQTSNILQIFISDSSSATGAGLTGLTNASSSLVAYYHRENDTTATAISLVSMTVGTFTSGGFKEIDATNMPGWYQFCPPDAAFAAAAKSCGIHLKGATNMAPMPIEVQLSAFDPNDSVRMGMTALPNAAAEAAGGLYTRGTGAGQIKQSNNGEIDANATRLAGTTNTGRDIGASVLLSTGTGTGQLDFTSGVVKADATKWAGTTTTLTSGVPDVNIKTITAGIIAAASFAANALDAVWSTTTRALTDKAGFALSSGGVQAIWDALTSALTTSGSIGKRIVDNLTGDIYARIGAPAGASVSADIAAVKVDSAAIKAKTDNLPATPAATGDAMTLTSGERTTLAASIWNALTSGLSTSASIGKLLVDNVNATISSRLATAGYTTPPTAAANADAIWDETLADHLTSGTTGAALNAAGSAGDPWGTALPGAYGSGTAGKLIGDNVNASIAAVKAKTDNLPGAPAATGDAMTLTSGERTTLAASIWNALTSGLTTSGSIGKRIVDFLTGDIFARVGAPAGASVSADIAAVKVDSAAVKAKTDNLPTAPAGQVGYKKNTALAGFVFPMTSSSTHLLQTGLTVAVQRSIDGGAWTNCANAAAELSAGFYKIDLAAADLNGDLISLKFSATGGDTRAIQIRTQA